MDSNLLFVPYRKTERFELGSVLRDVIDKEYFQTPTAFEGDLQEVDTLRNDILELGVTRHDLALLKRYYIHLSTLESKFPKDVAEFPWYGTLGYRVSGPVKIKSFLFERINLVYNMAALYTQMGIEQDRSNDECLKKACLYFQYAASHFAYVSKLAKEDETVQLPLDLQEGTIETLRLLCLAQAQEVFWQKASADKVKDSLASRLALQVSDYYDQSLQASYRSEGIRSEWVNHMTLKKFHFEAVAEFRASLISLSSSKYGEEVAHLQKAQKAITNATRHTKFVSESVKKDFDGLVSTVHETLRRAEKDNDLIYLQDVPTELPPITKAPVTKDMPIDELEKPFDALRTGNYGTQLFADLLPFYVIQACQAFRERQNDYVEKHLISPVKSLTKILQRFISEQGLPSSIDAIDKPLALPGSLIERQQDVRARGGSTNLTNVFEDMKSLAKDAEKLLQGAKERLQIEANEDESLRFKQGAKHWNRATSREAAATFHDQIAECEMYLTKARAGDEVVESELSKILGPLKILESDEKTLREYIPNSQTPKLDPSLKRAIADLKDALAKARKLELERENFISVVQVKSRQFNILPKIVSEYKSIQQNFKNLKVDESTFEPVFSKHIKNFQGDLDFIEQQKDKQKKLEDLIAQLNLKFQHLEKAQGSNHERERVLKNLDAVYNMFVDVQTNMCQGLKFYNDLNNKLQDLMENIDKYVYERRLEARDLEVELNARFQQLDLNPRRSRSSSPQKPRISKLALPDDTQGTPSPVLIAPRAKPAKPSGIWQPDSGIKFG